ncbi:MAG: AAA family ATPase [Saprospiraceae bacterium]|nr:AAA family ATPase [Saprospiraceae bacterium]
MELTNFSCENWKAFKSAEVEIKPITILLGPNSVGKSSLNRVLLLFSQSISHGNVRKSVLQFDKNQIQDSKSLFRNLDISKLIDLSFEFVLHNDFEKFPRQVLELIIDIIKRMDSRVNIILHDEFEFIKQNDVTIDFFQKLINKIGIFYPKLKNNDEINDSLELLFRLGKIKDQTLKLTFKLANREGRFVVIDKIIVKTGRRMLIEFSLTKKNNRTYYDISSDYDETNLLHKYKSNINCVISDRLNLQYFKLEEFDLSKSKSFFIDFFFLIIHQAYRNLKNKIENEFINYIPPIREFSKESYNFYLGDSDIYTVDADKIIDILADNPSYVDKINQWFQKGEDYELIVQKTNNETELKIKHQGLIQNINGLGSGISEVLPVLVRILESKPGSINIIEHPEIHLHPKMQGDLVDFLIENIKFSKKGRKHFIIETHSEYLLHRLRRKIAEKEVKADEINLYFLSSNNELGSSKLEPIIISDKGDFNWPQNFSTVLDDTEVFIMNNL